MADVINPNEATPPTDVSGGEVISKEAFEALTAEKNLQDSKLAELQAKVDGFEQEKKEKSFAKLSKDEQEKVKLQAEREALDTERRDFEQRDHPRTRG